MSSDQKQGPYSSTSEVIRLELSQIDASIRSASLFFVISAIAWLLIGTCLLYTSPSPRDEL